MMPHNRTYVSRAVIGLGCAFIISFIVVGASTYLWSQSIMLDDLPLWRFSSLAQGIVVGLPYGILALLGVSALRAWAAAGCITALLWGYYLHVTVSGQADHGIGIAMFFSPAPVLGAALLSLLILADDRPADEIASHNSSGS